ncbi:MAG TPA: hypothetical protein DCZ69_07325 [Syntrophobacteraceae bacterium]|nr:hypothetical protein [Syntrophobacteraceae bacterium]
MKKGIIAIVVLLVLVVCLWGGATYYFGMKTEQQYQTLLQKASQSRYFTFVNQSYERGFLGSKARTVMEVHSVPGAAADNQTIKITLDQAITHGPFPIGKSGNGESQFKPVMAVVDTKFVPSPDAQGQFKELTAQVPEIGAIRDTTTLYLDGNGVEYFVVPAFKRTFGDEEKVTVDWKGLTLQVNFSNDFKGFKGSLNIPGLVVEGKDGDLKVKDVNSTFNFAEGISGLSLGDASFTLAELGFAEKKDAKPVTFSLRGFNASTSNKASGDVVNSMLTVRTDQMKLEDVQYGPGNFELEFRNLDAAMLAKLQKMLRETEAQPKPQSDEASEMMNLAKYGEILAGLLKKSPEIELKRLDLKTSEGDFTGNAKISFDGTKAGPDFNVIGLAGAIAAQADCRVGERLLHRILTPIMKDRIISEIKERAAEDDPQAEPELPDEKELNALVASAIEEQLNALMQQGILQKGNGEYRSTASYKAGQIVLNGRPLSLQELLMGN